MLAVAIVASGILAIASSSCAAEANRAESDAVVAEAEKMVMQAGQADPVDTKLIHQAMDKLHVALKIDPRNDSAYVDLGFCYGVLRDGDTAIDMYRTATDLNPSGSNFIELADIYMRVGDTEDALLAANAGTRQGSSNARLYNAKGMALNDLQRFGEAEEAWEKALQAQSKPESRAGKSRRAKRRPDRPRQHQQAFGATAARIQARRTSETRAARSEKRKAEPLWPGLFNSNGSSITGTRQLRSGSASRRARATRRRERITETNPTMATKTASPAGTPNAFNVSIFQSLVRLNRLRASSVR